MKKQLMTFLLCGSLFATAQQPVDYVNPFIGTSNYGTTNPGAVCPQALPPFLHCLVLRNKWLLYSLSQQE